MKRVVVIGGGAAGLMAAKAAADGGNDVTVVEKNSRPARKMMITGKGRCNVTNDADIKELVGAVTGNGRFLYSSFNMFSSMRSPTTNPPTTPFMCARTAPSLEPRARIRPIPMCTVPL